MIHNVSIRREGLVLGRWWWHVVGTGYYGHALTEASARRKAAKAILAYENRQEFEKWTRQDAEATLDEQPA